MDGTKMQVCDIIYLTVWKREIVSDQTLKGAFVQLPDRGTSTNARKRL